MDGWIGLYFELAQLATMLRETPVLSPTPSCPSAPASLAVIPICQKKWNQLALSKFLVRSMPANLFQCVSLFGGPPLSRALLEEFLDRQPGAPLIGCQPQIRSLIQQRFAASAKQCNRFCNGAQRVCLGRLRAELLKVNPPSRHGHQDA